MLENGKTVRNYSNGDLIDLVIQYEKTLNAKVQYEEIKGELLRRLSNREIIIFDDDTFETYKTKEIIIQQFYNGSEQKEIDEEERDYITRAYSDHLFLMQVYAEQEVRRQTATLNMEIYALKERLKRYEE